MKAIENKPLPSLKKNDRLARVLIIVISIIVFAAVVLLGRVKIDADLGFDIHVFALINALINATVSFLLIAGLIAIKRGKYRLHKKIMLGAIMLSVLFFVSYFCHHLLAGDTRFGDMDHNGMVTDAEKAATGSLRTVYYILLGTHIPLAGIVLPFILFVAYRGLTAEYRLHKRLARITWPIWLYVAISGVLVYVLISPYY